MRKLILVLGVVAGVALSAGRAADSTASFVPKDFNGWEGLIKDYWSVSDDGTVTGRTTKKQTFNTFLCSKKKYKDFEMSFKVKLTGTGWTGNSGVQIRSEIADMKTFAVKGPQCDMGGGYWGSLYGERFGGMMKSSPAAVVKGVKMNDFNDYSIKCVGQHVTIKINGATAVDQDFAKLPAEGIIAFQLHGGPPMEVIFKDIVFKDLSAK
jgi:hypothetical protein